MKITRRELAGALAGSTILLAQTQPETADQLRKEASARLRRNADALAKVQIPMAAEPAFFFRAQ